MAAKRNAQGLSSALPRKSLNDEELVSFCAHIFLKLLWWFFFRGKHQSILVAWDWKDKNLNQSKKLFAYKRCLHDSQKSTKWQYLLLWLLVKFEGLLIDTTLCYVLETACVQESSTSFDISHIVYNTAQLPIVDCHFPDLLLRVRRTPLGNCQVKRYVAQYPGGC